MKIKIITLVYIFLIGSYGFSDKVFLTGGLSLTPETHISAFNSRVAKIQPAVEADVFFLFNFGSSFKAGLKSGIKYSFSSNLDGGWSYPGFSGIETGIDIRAGFPKTEIFEMGTGFDAGWYRYNLTENFFFLPSVLIYPSFRIYDDEYLDLWVEVPVKYYFHRQADIFISAGLKLRAVFK